MFSLGGIAIHRASVRLPRFGVWTARVRLARPASLDGARVALEIGDLTLAGTAAGGTFAERSSYLVTGGAGRWGASVRARQYRADNGIRLSSVVQDLAADVGEEVRVDAAAERLVGYSWMRPAGPAAAVLTELRAAWRVGADGITRVGPRPRTVVPASVRLALESFDPSTGCASISSIDDVYAALTPGAAMSVGGIEIDASDVTYQIAAGSVRVEIYS